MNLRRAYLFIAAVLACTSSADPEIIRSCPSAIRRAVAVNVRDASNGRPAGRGATLYGSLHSSLGLIIDTVRVVTPDSLTLYTGATPGIYDLRLVVPGYAEWTKAGIAVPADSAGCFPKLTTVDANVERLP